MSAPEEGFRVLVIEDDPQLLSVIASLLEDEGYLVATAESGEKAIEVARDERFDLIVADIRMPGIDGLDALEHLRSADPTLQSLVMTGYASEDDPIRALHIGVQAYLRKPFSLDDFLARVRELSLRCLSERRQRHAFERIGNSLNWALRRSLAEKLQHGGRTLVDLVHVVQELAEGVGSEAASRGPWMECAALVGCLRRFGLQGTSPVDEPPWPEPVEAILSAVDERWDGTGVPEGLAQDAIPIAARIVAVALAAWEHGFFLGKPESLQLSELEPGRLDPQIVQIFADHKPVGHVDSAKAGQRLLPLAAILLENGAYGQVREIYGEVLSGSPLARERMEALLGLTQVALQQNEIEEAMNYARQIINGSESVGPLSRGSCYMKLGVALSNKGLSAGVECFKRARLLFSATRHTQGEVEATLALAHFGNQVLELTPQQLLEFVSPTQLPRWVRSTPWILPCLLDRCENDAVIRRAVRIVQAEVPGYLERLMHSPSLSAVAKHRLTHIAATPEVEGKGGPEPKAPAVQFYSLIDFEMFYQGTRLSESLWPTQKVKFLLARLAWECGRPVSEDVLIDEFWAGELEKGRRNLSWSLTQLRKIIREQAADVATILRKGTTITLVFEEAPWHDVHELEKALSEAEQPGPLGAKLCSTILSLYRGPYLPNCYMDWTDRVRDRLERRVSDILTRALQSGPDFPTPLRAEVAHRLLEADPCHQPACAELMTQFLSQGRPEEAIRLYNKLEHRVKRDLGMEPDLKLVELSYRAQLGLTSSHV